MIPSPYSHPLVLLAPCSQHSRKIGSHLWGTYRTQSSQEASPGTGRKLPSKEYNTIQFIQPKWVYSQFALLVDFLRSYPNLCVAIYCLQVVALCCISFNITYVLHVNHVHCYCYCGLGYDVTLIHGCQEELKSPAVVYIFWKLNQ